MAYQFDSAWGLSTRLIHAGERAPVPVGLPTSTPVYNATTYLFPDAETIDQAFADGLEYVYSRYGNPTVNAFEQAMAGVESGVGAVAFSSGMAALHVGMLAAATPHEATHPKAQPLVASQDLYGATTKLINEFFAAQGFQVVYCDLADQPRAAAIIHDLRPAFVFCEQISNPLLRVLDLAWLAEVCHAVDSRLVVDSTMATPVLQRPIEYGADLVIHSATKFIGGHGDVTAGVVIGRSPEVVATLRSYSRLLGAVLGPSEASLALRGLKTLGLRVRQQSANALAIARWLSEQPQVERVYYPGLADHPQHALAQQVFGGVFGALVSFDLRAGTREAALRLINHLHLVLPGTSLGDLYSLVSAPLISSHRALTAEQRWAAGIGDGMLRLSIGIEDVNDLIADLGAALQAVN